MISDLLYILKCAVLSILFIGILQIEVNHSTLEKTLTKWFYQSSIPKHIQTAAAGGALAIENAYKSSRESIHNLFSSHSKTPLASKSER